MKLEYIEDSSLNGPLIRLFDFDVAEAIRLRHMIEDLAEDSKRVIELHLADFVEQIDSCQLILSTEDRDLGIIKFADPVSFQCALTSESWHNIEGLIDPFTRLDGCGFQWLNETSIPFLISLDGRW